MCGLVLTTAVTEPGAGGRGACRRAAPGAGAHHGALHAGTSRWSRGLPPPTASGLDLRQPDLPEDARDLAAIRARWSDPPPGGCPRAPPPPRVERGAQTWVEVGELSKTPRGRPDPGTSAGGDGGDPAAAGRQAATGGLRPEGPAAGGDPAAGEGPALRRRDRGLPPARAGWPAMPAATSARPGAACRRVPQAPGGAERAVVSGERSAARAGAGGASARRPRAPGSITIQEREPAPAELTGPRCSLAVRFQPTSGGEAVRLIDNRVLLPQLPLEDPPCSEPC